MISTAPPSASTQPSAAASYGLHDAAGLSFDFVLNRFSRLQRISAIGFTLDSHPPTSAMSAWPRWIVRIASPSANPADACPQVIVLEGPCVSCKMETWHASMLGKY